MSTLTGIETITAPAWRIEPGTVPVVATAVHAGHDVRPEVARHLALGEDARRYEEDPYTDGWMPSSGTQVHTSRSRFEVDLNRPREGAIYLRPEDAWGLDVWREPPPADLVERSRRIYDAFYRELESHLAALADEAGSFVLYDLHSYNHRRGGAPADQAANPDVNVGTGSMPPDRWSAVIDRLVRVLRRTRVGDRRLDVRENVRFEGGWLPRWIHRRFPERGCAVALDVKKIYMDEHTGDLHGDVWATIGEAVAATVEPVVDALPARW